MVVRAARDTGHRSSVIPLNTPLRGTGHASTATYRVALRIIVAGLVLATSGCANVGYYFQSVAGQLDIWRRERPVDEVLKDPAAPSVLKEKLAKVQAIRDFASRELGLPDNGSYRRYADLGRPYVVWNVFAAPEFSTKPVQWCFLFAGCVGYRGYFAEADAKRLAAELAGTGKDVHIGGVPAYSTLGWFPDPVLNTFVHYPEAEIARIVFHELSHQVVYAGDDTMFNESFAVAVEREGMRRWLAQPGNEKLRAGYEQGRERHAQFVQLIAAYRGKVEALYARALPAPEMREGKAAILRGMQDDYQRIRAGWNGFAGYDAWFARPPNNAMLASVAIYTRYVPAFEALLEREGRDLPKFYAAVRALAALTREERVARLQALARESDGDHRFRHP